MYPFRMYGRIIQIHRFSVTYTEEISMVSEDGEPTTAVFECTDYCNTQEEAEAIAARTGSQVITWDSSANEWLDGIEVDDVPDTYAEAVKIYSMGQAAYETLKDTPPQEDDLLAMAVDHEYRLTLLEVLN